MPSINQRSVFVISKARVQRQASKTSCSSNKLPPLLARRGASSSRRASGPGSSTSSWCRRSRGSRGSARHLDRDNTAERPRAVLVRNLDKADITLVAHGAAAGGAGRDGEGHGEVLVDVGGALLNDTHTLREPPQHRLLVLVVALGRVAVVAGDVERRGQRHAVGKGPRRRGVQHREDLAKAVRRHHVPGAAERRVDLRQGGTGLRGGLGHELVQVGGLDLARVGGLAQAVAGGVALAKDGSVYLGLSGGRWSACDSLCMVMDRRRWCTYDFVLASEGDDAALDCQRGSVAACIAGDEINAAVSGNEGRGRKREEENLSKHCDWFDVLTEGYV